VVQPRKSDLQHVDGEPDRAPHRCFRQTVGVLQQLCDDLAAEHHDLDAIVALMDHDQWAQPSAAAGWSVADQISHLAFFDGTGTLALTDDAAFASSTQQLIRDAAHGDPSIVDGQQPPEALLDLWRTNRGRIVAAARNVDTDGRIAWYGPPMSPASFVSARLMETWAHGQDIVDVVHADRVPTNRLRHIVQLGFRARRFSYGVHRRDLPTDDVRLELTAPDGSSWTYGDDQAHNVVRGSALDFCLLVTQRRHRDDVALDAHGAATDEWLSIAQAFAGPPGPGRARRSRP
jgi:uncharacterized protein (TIGR03084 family)